MDPEAEKSVPRTQRLDRIEDLDGIRFSKGLAALMVPVTLLDAVPLVNDIREDSPRLKILRRRIRYDGYRPNLPVICRVGRLGRWVVEDGGHRLTAARQVAREWWPNIYRRKVSDIYFLLYATPGSWSRLEHVPEHLRTVAAESTGLSERARARLGVR